MRGRRTRLRNIKQPLFDNLISSFSFSFWQFLNVFDQATSGNADTKTAEIRVRRMTL